MKLLFIEDDYAVRTAYTHIISNFGFEVHAFENAESAWESYQKNEYAVVLTDWELPGISGFELCSKILKLNSNNSVLIIITGKDNQEKLDKIIKAGIDDYILKSPDKRELNIRLIIAAKIFMERNIIKNYKTRIIDIHSDFSQIFNSINNAIAVIDNENSIIQVNRAFIKTFDIKKPIIMKKCYEVFREIFCFNCIRTESIKNSFVCPLSKKTKRDEAEIEITLKNDRTFIFLLSVSPLFDKNNIKQGIIIIFKDITARRLIENRYKSLFEESKDMIITTSIEGDILEINSTGIELLGVMSFSQLKNKKIFDFYNNKEDKNYFYRQIEEKGYIKDFEVIIKRDDGKNIFVLESTSPIRNNSGNIIEYKSIIKDISKRIKSEQNLMKLNCELADINEKLKKTQMKLVQQEKLASIGQLSAGIAHEINNPLGFIVSNFSSIRNYFVNMHDYIIRLENLIIDKFQDNIKEKIKKFRYEFNIDFIFDDLNSIFNESSEGFERIISIINNLKNFTRQDNVRKFELCDINSLIETTLSIAWNEIKYYAEVKKELNEIPEIECIRNEISQVLLNIIVNAAQAVKSQEKKTKGIITIRTKFNKQTDKVICEISDNGPGIPLEIMGKIFDPFFTTKEVGQGTGLGLSISYEIIVNKHNGDFGVKTDPGEGTSFIIKLPLIQPKEKIKK